MPPPLPPRRGVLDRAIGSVLPCCCCFLGRLRRLSLSTSSCSVLISVCSTSDPAFDTNLSSVVQFFTYLPMKKISRLENRTSHSKDRSKAREQLDSANQRQGSRARGSPVPSARRDPVPCLPWRCAVAVQALCSRCAVPALFQSPWAKCERGSAVQADLDVGAAHVPGGTEAGAWRPAACERGASDVSR